jgi:N-acetylneuraminate synthase/sialic acid synthase
MAQINLDGTLITEASPAYVIAGIGHNHMGDVDVALQMVDTAAAVGVDCVKFQRIDAERLFTQAAYAEGYNSENAFAATYGQHRDALTLSDDDFKRVMEKCDQRGVTFACTPFEEWSADFLYSIGCEVFKMASFHMHDTALIFHVAAFDKPMILSTGNSTKTDIKSLCDTLHGYPEPDKYALLHCTSEYPVYDASHINLGALLDLQDEFGQVIWGYSHHHPSVLPALSAYYFGARIIETHFTLARSWKGTDQKFSLDPDNLRRLVSELKMAHELCGTRKTPYREEAAPIRKMSRSVYPKREIAKGEIITADAVELKAPGDGIRPDKMATIIGKEAVKPLTTDQPIQEGDFR